MAETRHKHFFENKNRNKPIDKNLLRFTLAERPVSVPNALNALQIELITFSSRFQ
jgi:hypothetical protein